MWGVCNFCLVGRDTCLATGSSEEEEEEEEGEAYINDGNFTFFFLATGFFLGGQDFPFFTFFGPLS